MTRRIRPFQIVVLTAIALIPVIYAGALVWSNEDPTHNLDGIAAAVVDLDTGATASNGEQLDLGDEVRDELVASTASNNFDWSAVDADAAKAGLESGAYAAVLTIPETFSADVASAGDDDALAATAAELSVQTNDGSNLIVGSIAATIGERVTASLAAQVSEEYLDNVYVGFTDVHSSLHEAADGATQLADGAADAHTGSAELVTGLAQLRDGAAELRDGLPELATGASGAADGAASLSSGLEALRQATAALPDSATRLADGASSAAAGAKTLAAGADTVASGSASALAGAQRLDGGLQQLLANWDALPDVSRKAALQQLEQGAASLVGDGSATNPGLTALSAGAQQLDAGAASLGGGLSTLADGTAALAASAPSLTQGVSDAADGGGALASGTAALRDGVGTVQTGADALADGAADAASGGTSLDEGLAQLDDGSSELATQLADGVAEVPSYTDGERQHLSAVAATPVDLEAERINEVPAYGYGLAPYFMSLALWVGALAFYLMTPALSARALAGRGPSVVTALRSFLPGAAIAVAQSLLMVGVLVVGLGVHAVNVPGLFGMALLTSLTFVAVNQALNALLGAPGRFVALLMIVLQLSSAGGTYPVETAPAAFQALHGVLPLNHAVEAFRSLIAGGSIGIAEAVPVLLAWLLGALAVTWLASARARRSQRRAVAEPAVVTA